LETRADALTRLVGKRLLAIPDALHRHLPVDDGLGTDDCGRDVLPAVRADIHVLRPVPSPFVLAGFGAERALARLLPPLDALDNLRARRAQGRRPEVELRICHAVAPEDDVHAIPRLRGGQRELAVEIDDLVAVAEPLELL